MKIQIRIREQLCLLIALTALLSLMVLSVSVWVQSHHYIMQTRAHTLEVTASLKADQLAQDIALFHDSVVSMTTREKLQAYIKDYNDGNTTDGLREDLATNVEHAVSGGAENSVYLQAAIYPRSAPEDLENPVITRVTGAGSLHQYELPSTYPNGTKVYLGDPGLGYPPQLYPNFTWPDTPNPSTIIYEGRELGANSSLVLGPMFIDNNVTLISMTVPILNNTSRTDLLGWMTIILDAKDLYTILRSNAGLGRTGEVVVIGPALADNLFSEDLSGRSESANADVLLQFKVPPSTKRHPDRNDNPYLPFTMGEYPAVLKTWSGTHQSPDDSGYLLNTHNENGRRISVGYAHVNTPLVDWVIVFGQTRDEVLEPIKSLRDTVLACVFSVFGAIIIVCFPLAHYAVKPIRALRTAAENSVMTYEVFVPPSVKSDGSTEKSLLNWHNSEKPCPLSRPSRKPPGKKIRSFQIPERVPEKKHLIHDELTDLTYKFNEMVDELSAQYARLEERVKMRTAELEYSRNEAQAANESKTLFIANVSHELRTPLNGIIGMCAVAMQEESVSHIRQSLKIIYKSSDLLLHLLNDLLTFSRSSYGQQLSIEEDTFRLVDVGSQLVSIFEKQARDADVSLKVVFLGPTSPYPNSDQEPEDAIVAKHDIAGNLRRVQTNVLARGPADTGPLREIGLRGDKNRILQILMNLVSNSLKFTPAKGQIEVRIRCKEMVDLSPACDISNADTLADLATTSGREIPTISIRKASGIPEVSEIEIPQKGLLFDFEVEDTGAGIPEHLQHEIFKPFVQGDLTLSKKHGGTGLGLAICSQLAEMMGGSINLKSTVEIGSTFTLSLPLKYTKEKVPSVSGSLARSGRRPSMSSSVQFETFSARSGRSMQPHPQSARTSLVSQEKETHSPGLEAPRLVGYSQPFILDGNDSQTDEERLPGSRSPVPRRRRNEKLNRPPLESIQSATGTQLDMTVSAARQPTTETVVEAPSEQSTPPTVTPLPTPLPTPAPTPYEPPTPSLRVLVAEDNQVNQQVILRLLKLEKVPDHSVTLAEDGEQALSAVQTAMADPTATPYTLVFMDIQMPKMDGIEATKRIRALGFDAPIVALTAFDHDSNRKNCEEAGMNAFLGKPIKRTALKKVLAEFSSGGAGAAGAAGGGGGGAGEKG